MIIRPCATLLLFGVLLGGCAAAPVDRELLRYAQLQGHKAFALARDPAGRHATGMAAHQSTTLLAAFLALRRCEAQRRYHEVGSACDIVRLDGQRFEPASAFLARIDGRNPAHPALAWHVRGPRAEAFVLGSIHVLKQALLPLPPVYQRAWEQADALVVEIDTRGVSAARAARALEEHASLEGGRRLRDVVPDGLLEDLAGLPLVDRVVLRGSARLKPGQVAAELRRAAYLARGFMPQLGIENQFLRRATHARLPVIELEAFEDELRRLHATPLDVQVRALAATMRAVTDDRTLDRIVEAFWRADVQALAALRDGDSERERLRNQRMAQQLAGLLAGGEGVYVALIGAGHLPGDGGVIDLLAERGFALARLDRAGNPLQ
jgi:hypothetical protein